MKSFMYWSNKWIFIPCPNWEYPLDWKWALGSIPDCACVCQRDCLSSDPANLEDGKSNLKLLSTISSSTFSSLLLFCQTLVFPTLHPPMLHPLSPPTFPPSLHDQPPLNLDTISLVFHSISFHKWIPFLFPHLRTFCEEKKNTSRQPFSSLSWHVFLPLLPSESQSLLSFQGSQTHLLRGDEWKCPSFQTFGW